MTPKRMAGLALAGSILGGAPTLAVASDCEAKVAELDRLVVESEGLDAARLNAVRMMRDVGARQCDLGNEATANPILDSQIRALAGDRERVDSGLSKARLTPAYLKGSWCTWQLTEDPGVRRDSARYFFYDDGAFHIGPHPSYRLDTSAPPWPHRRFLDHDYTRLIEMGDNTFRTEDHGMRTYIWQRGNC